MLPKRGRSARRRAAGVERIACLGESDSGLSPHLRPRHETRERLRWVFGVVHCDPPAQGHGYVSPSFRDIRAVGFAGPSIPNSDKKPESPNNALPPFCPPHERTLHNLGMDVA